MFAVTDKTSADWATALRVEVTLVGEPVILNRRDWLDGKTTKPWMKTITLAGWINRLATHKPVPSGGALAVLTLAGAAALGAKAAGAGGAEKRAFVTLADEFLAGVGEDGRAFLLAVREGRRRECLENQRGLLEKAVDLVLTLDALFDDVPESWKPDVAAAARLGRAAAEALVANFACNLAAWEGREGGVEQYANDLVRWRERLGAT